jgi:toxin ParE1/3/4
VKVAFRQAAIDDLRRTYQWLAADSAATAERFVAALRAEIELLSGHPFLGRRRNFRTRGLRSWPVRGFEKHILFYRVTSRVVEIVRVLHGSRDIRELL